MLTPTVDNINRLLNLALEDPAGKQVLAKDWRVFMTTHFALDPEQRRNLEAGGGIPADRVEAIQRAVAEQFGMRVSDLKQKNNSRNVVVPRQIAMYLAKQMTEASLPEIGRQFGNKHHTTVMHSIAKIDEQRRADKDLNRTLNKLLETLNG